MEQREGLKSDSCSPIQTFPMARNRRIITVFTKAILFFVISFTSTRPISPRSHYMLTFHLQWFPSITVSYHKFVGMFLLLDACCITHFVLLDFISLIRMSKSMCLLNPRRTVCVVCSIPVASFQIVSKELVRFQGPVLHLII